MIEVRRPTYQKEFNFIVSMGSTNISVDEIDFCPECTNTVFLMVNNRAILCTNEDFLFEWTC